MTKSTNEEMELKKNDMRMTKTYATDKQTSIPAVKKTSPDLT